MSLGNEDMIVILVAGYSSVTAAVGGFDAVSAVFDERDARGAAYCNAAVINPHDMDVSSRVLRETPPSRQRQAVGAHIEHLAKRLGRYLGAGLALAGGPAGGGGEDIPVAAIADDSTGPLDRDDLNKLGAVQETASAVLIGIFPAVMSDRIATATQAADTRATKELSASAEQLEAQIAAAERKSIADAQR